VGLITGDATPAPVAARGPGRLAKWVSSVMDEARKRNPGLAGLDRLAETVPAERAAQSYLSYEYIFA